MKSLQSKIFVFLTYLLLSLNLFSMENSNEENENSLSHTFPVGKKLEKTLEKTKLKPKIAMLDPYTPKPKNPITKTFSFKKDENKEKYDEKKEIGISSNIFFEIKNKPFTSLDYLGPLPEGADHIMKAFHQKIIARKLQPMLVKVVGPKDVGKTTLIRTIAKRLCSNENLYYEIDVTHKQQNSSKTDPQSYITSTITNFYAQINFIKSAAIIAFIKGLPLKGIDFKKLRNFLSDLQQPAPLLIIHEGKNELINDGDYHDKVIHVDKPTREHIKEFLAHIYTKNNLNCEGLSEETFERLEGFLIPRVERIAEETIRKAILEKTKTITNGLIQESIGSKRIVRRNKEFKGDRREVI